MYQFPLLLLLSVVFSHSALVCAVVLPYRTVTEGDLQDGDPVPAGFTVDGEQVPGGDGVPIGLHSRAIGLVRQVRREVSGRIHQLQSELGSDDVDRRHVSVRYFEHLSITLDPKHDARSVNRYGTARVRRCVLNGGCDAIGRGE